MASPAPQAQQQQPPASASPRSATSDHIAKASALLDSVVDSIQSPRADVGPVQGPLQITTSVPTNVASTDPSPTARHRALADALFGTQDRDATSSLPQPEPLSPKAVTPSEKKAPEMTRQRSQSRSESPSTRSLGTPKPSPSMPNVASPFSPVSPSASSSAHGHGQIDPHLLALDVQRRAEAATLALRKTPSNHKMTEAFGSTRRRISPNQISSPKLMSASTSVDTIPLRPATSPSNTQPAPISSSKFGSRLRKLTGTLRSKQPVVTGEEVTPFPIDVKTPPSTQTLTYNPSQLASRGEPVTASAIEPRKFETQTPVVPSPPASAGPGLKGFMSRFRKQRQAEPAPVQERRAHPSSATTSLSPSSPSSSNASSPPVSYVQSAPATKAVFSRSSRPVTPQPQNFSPEPPIPEDSVAPTDSLPQNDALRQLFDAASNLGLDQAALTDLIARSPSTSSRSTAWTKVVRSNSVADTRKSRRNSPHSPVPTDGRPSTDATAPRPSTEIRQLNIRKNTDASTRARQDPKDATASMVVRRTIILPSDPRASTVDWNTLLRKQSTSRKRRSAGAGSIQSKGSVQDRVPTPPPNRSTLKRFSNDSSPPVPHLPQSFSVPLDVSSAGQVEKSSSAYDSL